MLLFAGKCAGRLLEIKQRLCFDYRYLVGICGESVNVNLGFSRLEIYVAEGLQAVYLKFREPDEHAAVSAESFEVVEALPIQRRRQTLNLEICHIADVFTQCAFM